MKNKIIKKTIGALLILPIVIGMTGCSSENDKEYESKGEVESGFSNYNEIFQDGTFYIRHEDGKYEALYLGETTFDKGKTSSSEDYTKTAWFKDDFNNIPTLYKGDSLIMYTEDVFDEGFVFERFYDYGYSIGLRNIEITKSGRFSIKTSTNEDTASSIIAYPGGDTSKIEDFTNNTVIIDTLGGVPLRDNDTVKKNKGEEINTDSKNVSFLTKAGTIGGLEKDGRYKAEIYEGTIKHDFIFTANVRILAQFEYFTSYDYDFESDTIINIKIPEEWESGYYMINGLGMFRYVNGNSYDDNTDFNIPNESFKKSNDESNDIYNNEDDYEKNDNYYNNEILKKSDYAKESVKVTLDEIMEYKYIATGNPEAYISKTVEVTKTGTNVCTLELNDKEGLSDIILCNIGETKGFKFKETDEPGIYKCVFFVDENAVGKYSIKFPAGITEKDIKYISLNIAE